VHCLIIYIIITTKLHEVVLPLIAPILVAGRGHVLLREEIIVGMLLLPLLLLSLLCRFGLLLFLQVTVSARLFRWSVIKSIYPFYGWIYIYM
jgi:hypothetical protein